MYAKLITSSWVSIRDGCQMRYCVNDADSVDFMIKDCSQVFEFGYEAEPLRQFIDLALRALAEMNTIRDQEEVERTGEA